MIAFTQNGDVYTCGKGTSGQLGHGVDSDELVPRLVEGLAGKKVVGASAGGFHSVVFTEAGELLTCGNGVAGQLGHGGSDNELVPRLVQALAGKKVVGAAAGLLLSCCAITAPSLYHHCTITVPSLTHH